MIDPTGYTALDLVGYTDRGTYSAVTNYVKNDLAHHNGIIWRCLIDDTIGITPVEGVNWTVFINAGSAAAEEIIAPIETSPAAAAHTSGTQLIYNDTLYDVIANISIGDSLTVGTNIQAAPKISSQIKTLSNQVDDNTTDIQTLTNNLTSIKATGSTNNTGATILNGTYFYLNGVLVRAKTDIASGATFTLNTNYKIVTDGVLNDNTFKIYYISQVASQSETIIPLPYGTIAEWMILKTTYYNGSREFEATGTNETDFPSAYLHITHGIIINASSVSSGYNVRIALLHI